MAAASCRQHSALLLLCCRKALALAADLSLDHLVIASDSKTIVDGIIKGVGGPHITVVKEINNRIAHFASCDFMFESRALNQEAHNLAKFVVSLTKVAICGLYPQSPSFYTG